MDYSDSEFGGSPDPTANLSHNCLTCLCIVVSHLLSYYCLLVCLLQTAKIWLAFSLLNVEETIADFTRITLPLIDPYFLATARFLPDLALRQKLNQQKVDQENSFVQGIYLSAEHQKLCQLFCN